jgi:predicted GNAT family N-acyltransferase
VTNIIFKVIKYGSDEYAEAIALRKEVLYEARGIRPTDYNEDDSHIQIVGFDGDTIIATCSLVPEENDCRMRYVAISSHIQGGGVGSKMLMFFEEEARARKFKSIYCHARDTAINFYKKNGYTTEGEMFEQVTIPHIKMRKILI